MKPAGDAQLGDSVHHRPCHVGSLRKIAARQNILFHTHLDQPSGMFDKGLRKEFGLTDA
jgi:hypothetical protein